MNRSPDWAARTEQTPAVREAGEAEIAGAFVRGYRSAGGSARITGPGSFTMAAVVQGNLLDFHLRRWLAGAETDEDRTRSAQRIVDFFVTSAVFRPAISPIDADVVIHLPVLAR